MYATAKAGLNMLVRALALDYTARGIRVNGVSPGATTHGGGEWDATKATGPQAIYLIGRYVRPKEIGDAVVFLASDEASAITGQVLTVDGGGTISLHDWLAGEVARRSKASA